MDEPTVLGRQRKGDPVPISEIFTHVNGKPKSRIVIAATGQKKVSRDHLEIRVESAMLVLTNRSKVNPIRIANHPDLRAGETYTIDDDCQMEIDNLTLCIERNHDQ
jgi:hypothetical protein